MTVALIGLVGALLAAALTPLVAARLERSRHRKLAHSAGRLILRELDYAQEAMRLSGEEGYWWPGALPTRLWDARAGDLIPEIDEKLWKELTIAYQIIDTRNRALQRARELALVRSDSTDKSSSSGVAELSIGEKVIPREMEGLIRSARRVEEIHGKLGARVRELDRDNRKRRSTVAIMVFAILFLGLLFIPFPNVNSATVAQQLQHQLGPDAFVECDPDGDDWACSVYQFDKSRSDCLLSETTSLGLAAAPVSNASGAVQFWMELAPGCTADGPANSKGSVTADGENIVYVTTLDPALDQLLEKLNLSEVESAPIPQTSAMARIWAAVWPFNRQSSLATSTPPCRNSLGSYSMGRVC